MLSDHTPIIFVLAISKPKPQHQQPIAKEVINSKYFREEHDDLANTYLTDAMPAHLRWQEHKYIIREAARRARNRLLLDDAASNHSRMQALATVARAVWRHDRPLLERLM